MNATRSPPALADVRAVAKAFGPDAARLIEALCDAIERERAVTRHSEIRRALKMRRMKLAPVGVAMSPQNRRQLAAIERYFAAEESCPPTARS